VNVPTLEASVADFLSGVMDGLRAVKFSKITVDSF